MTIKLGVIGGSLDSAVGRAHYAALSMINDVEVIGGAFSRTISKSRETAKYIGVQQENAFDEYLPFLKWAKKEVQVIIVLTPTDQHQEHVKAALRNGFDVISEKALCVSVQEANEIFEVKRESNRNLFVTFNYLGYPMVREVKRWIDQGKLGEIFHLRFKMPQEGFIKISKENDQPFFPQNWRQRDGKIPTVTLDLGVHLWSLYEYLVGEGLEVVYCQAENQGEIPNVVDNVNILAKSKSGKSVNFWYGKSLLGNRNGLAFEVYGTHGSIVWVQESPEAFLYTDKYGDSSNIFRGRQGLYEANKERYTRFKAGHPVGFIEAFANYYEDIFDIIKGEKLDSFVTSSAISALRGTEFFEHAHLHKNH